MKKVLGLAISALLFFAATAQGQYYCQYSYYDYIQCLDDENDEYDECISNSDTAYSSCISECGADGGCRSMCGITRSQERAACGTAQQQGHCMCEVLYCGGMSSC